MSAHCWLFKLAGNKIYENQCIMRFSSLLFVFHFIAFPPLLTQGLILYQMGLGFVTIFLSQFSIAGNIGVSHCDWSISSFLIRNWWTDISFAKWYPLSLSICPPHVILLGTWVPHFCYKFLLLPLTCLSWSNGLTNGGLASPLLAKVGSVRTLEARYSEMDRGRAG